MQFIASKKVLFNLLQLVIGVVERRQTMPILANALLEVDSAGIRITATDLEVELAGSDKLEEVIKPGRITVPTRKLLDITRALYENDMVKVQLDGHKLQLSSGKSHFTLATLPAADFTVFAAEEQWSEFTLSQKTLKHLLEKVHFSIAQQDVRYYLNGLLIELGQQHLRTVSSDGHRLSLCSFAMEGQNSEAKVILPRKGVTELLRLLENDDSPVAVLLGNHSIRVQAPHFTLTSKLIDGIFPDYEKTLFRPNAKELNVDKEALKPVLERVAVLANDKNPVIKLSLSPGKIAVETNNNDQEEAYDELEVDYQGKPIEMGYNVSYLLQAINALPDGGLVLKFAEGNGSVLIEAIGSDNQYVIMPMRV